MRVFFAVNLPQHIKKQITDAANDLSKFLPGAKSVPSDNLHITLHFIGETDSDGIFRLKTAAEECARILSPHNISVKMDGFGAFKSGKGHLVFAGVKTAPPNALHTLNAALLDAVKKYDAYTADKQKFTPHVTIFRKAGFAGGGKNILRDMEFSTDTFNVPFFSLMESLTVPLFDKAGGYRGMGVIYKSVFDVPIN